MAIVQRTSSVQGKWLDKKEVENGDKVKIVSEATQQVNPQGGFQLVAKVSVKSKTTEPVNVSINGPSKNALIDAFGEDSQMWVNKVVTAAIEKVVVGGKRGIALYLIPDGMVLKESDDGFLYIGHPESESGTVKDIKEPGKRVPYPTAEEEGIKPEDIPW